jgi:hypothetical protein
VYTKNHGKLLDLIEMFSEFDTIMAENLRRTSRKEISDHYL